MAERERATTLYIWFNSIKQNAAGNREMKEREKSRQRKGERRGKEADESEAPYRQQRISFECRQR